MPVYLSYCFFSTTQKGLRHVSRSDTPPGLKNMARLASIRAVVTGGSGQ